MNENQTGLCGCPECGGTCAVCLLAAPVGRNISRMADLISREIDAQIALLRADSEDGDR